MFDVNWTESIIRVLIAVLVGGAIGVEREYKNRPAGMRTHVLVCLGACVIALVECMIHNELLSAGGEDGITLNIGRLCAQVISGIGFLGAGTIFVSQKKIAGLTTAASLWNVGCLGLMIGYGFYWIALIVCVIVLIVLTFLQRIIRVNAVKRVEIRFTHRTETLAYINEFFQKSGIKVLDLDFHIESVSEAKDAEQDLYTNLYTLHLPSRMSYIDIVSYLSAYPHVQIVRTCNT